MGYEGVGWTDEAGPQLNPARLRHMDEGIVDLYDELEQTARRQRLGRYWPIVEHLEQST